MSSIKLGEEIGRGGYGVVYAIKDDNVSCVKTSNKNGTHCRKWSNEFLKIKKMISLLENNHKYKKFKRVKIVIPSEFSEHENICYMKLPRIYRPDKNNNKPTIQAQLGVESINLIHKGRGEFIGLSQIKQYLNTNTNNVDTILNRVSSELGEIMALIHYIGMNDAYDVELYLGKEHSAKLLKFYIADFDLTENIIQYDAETINRIAWSLDAVPYFPLESLDKNLYNIFKTAYMSIAESCGKKDIAEKVFENYG